MNFISFRNIFNLEIENVCHDSTSHWLPLQAQHQPQLQLDMKICGHNQRFSVFIFFSRPFPFRLLLPAGWAKSARNVNYLICLLPRPTPSWRLCVAHLINIYGGLWPCEKCNTFSTSRFQLNSLCKGACQRGTQLWWTVDFVGDNTNQVNIIGWGK